MVVVGRLVGTFEPALVIVTMAQANSVSGFSGLACSDQPLPVNQTIARTMVSTGPVIRCGRMLRSTSICALSTGKTSSPHVPHATNLDHPRILLPPILHRARATMSNMRA